MNTRGGKREGAGRPPLHDTPYRRIEVRVPEAIIQQLDAIKEAGGPSRNAGIIRAITLWLKNRGQS